MATAYENPLLIKSFPANGDLSSSQYKVVELGSSGVSATNATTDVPVGVLQNKPTTGLAADVMMLGISRCIAVAAITKGVKVSCTAAGKVQTAATGQHIVGIALEAASADGDIIPVLLTLGGAPLP